VIGENPRLSIASVSLGPALVSRTLSRERVLATLLVVFGGLAVGLAAVGLYGLIAYHVVQRTSEIGIRMALGARGADVSKAVLRRAFAWMACGVGLGAPLAMIGSWLARNFLFGLSSVDAGAMAAATAVLGVMGLVAAYIPARRASRVDPLTALRTE
jgi:ABC-type antimicrobial peptide transport system permease subunit